MNIEECIFTKSISLPAYLENNFKIVSIDRLPEKGVYLYFDEQGLSLCKVGEKGKVCVDFNHGVSHYRRVKGGGELIAKAVNHTIKPVVWDATGGLGRDTFVLASLGLNVQVFEQNKCVHALLQDGLFRASQYDETAGITKRIQLYHANAIELMPKLMIELGKPDVVYLDPMYPERQKSSAVKKEMAYFHDLVGLPEESTDEDLLKTAKQVAKKRIVVKRPRLGKYLCDLKPAYQYEGKSTRFDVYLPNI